ncbi:hypothetical protein GCM10022255_085660 [Dactylosporangium darangshiense]|uniref:Uncharacterized protein n=1 Tax=Dactylosporangium darangshiense TaxID=579108 RepID=A0ABP8DMJ5_9ACTN
MILPAGAGRLHNNWNIYETDMFNWRASFPVPVDAQVLHAWQQALFVAGERHGILRFEQADQIGYDRARDGFIGDFAAAHPDRPAQYADYPVGFILQHWNQLTVATRLAYVVGEDWHQPGDRIEESWCSSVGDLSFYAKVPGEDTGAPIDIYTDVDERTSPCRLYVEVSSKTDIFFPRNRRERRPGIEPIDNRLLAERNGRRLNAFLSDLRAATLAAHGRWEALGSPQTELWQFDEFGIAL